jgi:aminopeptidase N
VLLSNGNPAGARSSWRTGASWRAGTTRFPKPSYLFAVVAGDLAAVSDSFTTRPGARYRSRSTSSPRTLDKCDHAMRSLKARHALGRGALRPRVRPGHVQHRRRQPLQHGRDGEQGPQRLQRQVHPGAPDTATDADFAGIEGVVAHEYFHNWTGNRITCRDWFQLSLKEGFTVYRDQEFSADMGSRGVKRIEDVRMLRARQFPEDAGPMAHPVRPDSYIEINNFYTATVYEKGAEVVRMQANLLGPERFRAGTDLYFERFDGQAVTTDDFVACMERPAAST